jgi:hypothetical protein
MLSRCVGFMLLEALLALSFPFSKSNMPDAQTYEEATILVAFK